MTRIFAIVAFGVSLSLPAVLPLAAQVPGSEVNVEEGIVEHGGGCRKSSPPGQCCHMDKKQGRVHCH